MLNSCPFCALLKNPESDPTFVYEFEHSFAYLNFEQKAYPGQSILIFKDHYDHLHDVPWNVQHAVLDEMNILTKALLKTFGGFRANHQSLGNQVSHVHWHITPRYHGDLNEGGPPSYMEEERMSEEQFQERAAIVRNAIVDC